MRTLDEAWAWHRAARDNLKRMQRIGGKHWNDESLENSSLWRDEWFKEVDAEDIEREVHLALDPLDDLGVLVLFSVFEAAVREYLEVEIRPFLGQLGHHILEQAAEDALEGIQQGSFANRVLAPLQDQKKIAPELSQKVRQVRDYRNWIAHGRREPRSPSIVRMNPEMAYERLREFLEVLDVPT